MRRGLMAWDPQELPKAALDARLERLRAAMRRDKFDALLIYTNLVRPSAVNWLTGFTPYWSEGALLVPGSGTPVFATALSKRVGNWMRTIDPVSEIVNAPRPGKLLGERLATDTAVRRLGVLELDALPSGLYDDVAGAAPSVELADAGACFAGVRRNIDDAERNLLARANAIAVAALNQIDPTEANDAGTVAGQVEQHARLAGAEEAYIAIAADLAADRRLLRIVRLTSLGASFAVRASVAYKGAWVRRTRTFARDHAGRRSAVLADDWFKGLLARLDFSKPLSAQIQAGVTAFAGAELQSWMAERCVGSYPLEVVAASGDSSRPPPPGDVLILTLALTLDGAPWLGAAPVVRATTT